MDTRSSAATPPAPRHPAGTGAGRIAAAAAAAVAACLLLASPPPSRADIYRWEDAQGTVHFTDDVATIPARYRRHSTVVIRTVPSATPRPDTSPQEPEPAVSRPFETRANPPASEQAAPEAEQEKQELVSQVEQLKAKIAAKEDHIRTVDAKRSLAINPLRNRFVDPADLALYKKYKTELPGDREQLQKLESRLDSLKK